MTTRTHTPQIARRAVAVLAVTFGLAACQPRIDAHGYAPLPEQVADVVVGSDTMETVAQKIGRPSTSGVFDENAWYYISRRTQERPLREPEVLEQNVVVIAFNDAGVVEDIGQYGVEDGLVVDMVSRTTPTRGRSFTLAQQLLGNIGRYNNTSQSVSSADRRRSSIPGR